MAMTPAERIDRLERLIVLLVKEAGLKRDTTGQWWADDWTAEVTIAPDDLHSLLNELIPAGRTF